MKLRSVSAASFLVAAAVADFVPLSTVGGGSDVLDDCGGVEECGAAGGAAEFLQVGAQAVDHNKHAAAGSAVRPAAPNAEAKKLKLAAPAASRQKRLANTPKELPDELPEVISTNATAAAAAGVTGNKAENGPAFVSALVINVVMCFVSIGIFMQLRRRYPLTYANNVKIGIAPTEALGRTPEEIAENLDSRWGWYTAAMGTTTEQVADTMGLDMAMLLEFTNLGRTILARIGVPMILIMGPMNATFGGQPAWKNGDWLSTLSMGNVENGSWLYWIHALVVWYVVIVVQVSLYGAQSKFLSLRHKWLAKLSDKRANTIMVSSIPDELRSDVKLKSSFAEVFGEHSVASAFVVKDTSKLCNAIDAKTAAEQGLKEANTSWEQEGKLPEKRPQSWGKGDLIDYYTEKVHAFTKEIEEERARINTESTKVGGVNTHTGFVTFKERKYAELAALALYSSDLDLFEIELPPEPLDIIWTDLQRSPAVAASRSVVGALLIFGLYFAYMPCVVGISAFSTSLQWGPIWAGLAPTMGLQFMVAFLPTFIILIFQAFFTLKADAFAQKRLQTTYFWFQIVFVVLVTAIGNSVWEFSLVVFTDPLALPGLLGESMPNATHFYLNFLVLQWVTHSMNMIRYVMLSKFKALEVIFEEEEARRLSEPEDQDYYGIGSRSARFTINLVLGIVYGTLAPLMNLLCWVNFFVCRLVYGYLIPFAEQKKPDLGGLFWVDMLRHLFVGNIIYIVVMIGVLNGRAQVTGLCQPSAIAASSLFYTLWSMRRFERAFCWEKLPINAVLGTPKEGQTEMKGDYFQAELASS